LWLILAIYDSEGKVNKKIRFQQNYQQFNVNKPCKETMAYTFLLPYRLLKGAKKPLKVLFF